jgi:hypothetical protein
MYENCPLRYYRQRIKKDVVDKGGPASIAGERQHKQLEDRLRSGTPLPDETKQMESVCKSLLKKNWTIHPELELAVNDKLKPTGWWDADAWLRAKVDVVVLNSDETKAIVLDWKTGKRRPDPFQLEISAAMVFAHYKTVQEVDASFVWIKDRATDRINVVRKEQKQIWLRILNKVQRIEISLKEDVWQPKPSGLCPWCPARETCDYAY